MNKNINVVFVKDGSRLSEAAFLEAAKSAYLVECTRMDQDQEKIGAVVKDIFDNKVKKGGKVNQSYIKSQVIQALGSSPETHGELETRIMAFLHDNTGKQGDGKLLAAAKGRNGGTWRQCDYVAPVKDAKDSDSSEASE